MTKCQHENNHAIDLGCNEWLIRCDDCLYDMARIRQTSATTTPVQHSGNASE